MKRKAALKVTQNHNLLALGLNFHSHFRSSAAAAAGCMGWGRMAHNTIIGTYVKWVWWWWRQGSLLFSKRQRTRERNPGFPCFVIVQGG